MELSREGGNNRTVLPHSRDRSIITTLSGQFHYYHTLGTVLLLQHSRESSIITTLSGQFMELSRECGNNGTVPRV
jgi:hypothetical protein